MAIEIVDFPIKHGGSFHGKMLVHQRVHDFHHWNCHGAFQSRPKVKKAFWSLLPPFGSIWEVTNLGNSLNILPLLPRKATDGLQLLLPWRDLRIFLRASDKPGWVEPHENKCWYLAELWLAPFGGSSTRSNYEQVFQVFLLVYSGFTGL